MILRTNENELYVLGTIWSGDGLWFVSELNRLEKQYTDITIKMHLYGGSVFDGNLMCNALESSKSNISLEIIGLAASMGAIMALSVKEPAMVENGYIMLHAPKSGSYGEAKDHESAASLLRLMEKNFVKKITTKLQISEAEAKTYIEKDTWLDAEQALALGIISNIIPSKVETILPIEEPSQYGETEVYNLFSNILLNPAAIGLPENMQQNFNDNMKKLLIQTFALALTEASSDTAFIDALQEKLTAEKNGKESAESALKMYKDAQISAMVDGANLEENEKEIYRKIGETSGIEALATVLQAKQKPVEAGAPNIGAIIQNSGGSATPVGRSDWDFKKWQTEDPKGLEKMSASEPEKFKELFNANYK
ncbi:Clp protease ClpP [Amniculibacterium sp. G2-70]|uniref:Clp protease ClpP n=1 Tax=Amniculibacterium sp. G2-70 TaxID=2767188 RepID=UPI0016541AA7|nr:Clp protease ClpP [Amniculibacterium sp. G2-70]